MTQEDIQDLQVHLPTIPWQVNVHNHAMRLTKAVSAWLERRFPAARHPPRATFISAATWSIREERLVLQRRLRMLHRAEATYDLSIAFLAWARDMVLTEAHDHLWPLRWHTVMGLRHTAEALWSTRNTLRQALRTDRTAYVHEVANKAVTGLPNDFHRTLQKVVVCGRRKQRGTLPLPKLQNGAGEHITSYEAWAERWREFFQEQEGGAPIEFDELVANCKVEAEPCVVDWSHLPTLTQLEAVLRRTTPGRAYFDDLIPGEVLRKAAGALATVCFPLLLKHTLTATEPLLYKGGLLVAAYKGKGPSDDCASYRSLLVSSTLGKAHHRLFRSALMEKFEPYAMPHQLGGRPKQSVGLAALGLHLFLDNRAKAKISTGVIFIDIQNAFYRVVRQHAIPGLQSPAGLCAFFDKLGIGHSAYQDFLALIESPAAFDDADVPEQLKRIYQDAFDNTWYCVRGTKTLTATTQGTRPGDSYADLVFGFVLTRILRIVQDKMKSYGLLVQIPWTGCPSPQAGEQQRLQEYLGPIWADDIAVVQQGDTPLDLTQRISKTAGLLMDMLACFGMSPNMAKGKSEVLLQLRGCGSQRLKKALVQNDQKLQTVAQAAADEIALVGRYKHLGLWLTENNSPLLDLKSRFAIAHARLGQFRVAIFGNKALPLRKKVLLFDSLILSAVFCNVAAWAPFTTAVNVAWGRKLGGLYRRFAMIHAGLAVREWTDQRLQQEMGFVSPMVLLRSIRLRFLAHVVGAANDATWALLQLGSSWWHQAQADVDWLQSQRRFPLGMWRLIEDWPSWLQYIGSSPTRWKKLISRAVQHTVEQASLVHRWDEWHDAIATDFHQMCETTGPEILALATSQHGCIRCQQYFQTKAGWSVHAFKVHGRTTMGRRVAVGSQCPSCLKQYASHVALIHHLNYQARCRNSALCRGWTADLEPGMNSVIAGQQRPAFWKPPIQAEGPVLPPGLPHDELPMVEAETELCTSWTCAIAQISSHSSVDITVSAIKEATMQTVLHVDEIKQLFTQWSARCHANCAPSHWEQVHQVFLTSATATWFIAEKLGSRPRLSFDGVWERWCQDLPKLPDVPRVLKYRPVLMAHIFSGHRREGDLQSFLEDLQVPEPHCVRVLSVDIVFSESWGNLLCPTTFNKFKDAIRCGLLRIVCAGPPCETWSRARSHGCEDGGPLPVRDATHLRGLPELRLREVRQVSTGNDLLGVAIRFAANMLISNGFFLLEHPKDLGGEQPSIWRLAVIKLLLAFPNVRLCHVQQGLFGAQSAKPTTFLIVNPPPNADGILAKFRTRDVVPQTVSIGRVNGQWRTAALKAYPAALCRAIAAVVQGYLEEMEPSLAPLDAPADFEEFAELCVPPVGAQMGPDYHPTNLVHVQAPG